MKEHPILFSATMASKEIVSWKPILGYEGRYEVSDRV
jgi:hypothetical protein